jgi:hypothetical protein
MFTIYDRLDEDRPLIEAALKRHELPLALMAIPAIESAYRNFKSGRDPERRKPAGLWMMVPSTARHYGLRIGNNRDDRLQKERETEAAAHHLRDLYNKFHDWAWAVVAYNQGEFAVKKIKSQHADQDPWALMKKGVIKNYLARVTAAALLILKPEIIGHPVSSH